MVLKDVKKGIVILSSIVVLSFSVTGCGGGGGSGGDSTGGSDSTSGIAESERVAISEANSEQVTAVAIGIGSNSSSIPLAKSVSSSVYTSNIGIMETPALKKVFSTVENSKVLAESGSYECSEGGSISYSDSGTSATMSYNDCQMGGGTIKGIVSISANSDGTSATVTYTNFSMSSDGKVHVSFDSLVYKYQLDSNYEISSMSLTVNGYITHFDEKIEYSNYVFDITMGNDNSMVFTVNGFIKTACLDAWLEIKTTETIQKNFFDSCPTAGKIVVGGNNSSLTIDFNSDGSVDVSGAANEHYDSCTQLDASTCNL